MFGDIIEKRPVSIAKAKKILAEVKEPNYEQKQAMEYASKFAKVPYESVEKIVAELREAGIPRMRDRQLKKMVDIMPKSQDEIKVLMMKEDLTLSKKDIDKILEILGKFR